MALRNWFFDEPAGTVATTLNVVAEDGAKPSNVGTNAGTGTIKFSDANAQTGNCIEFVTNAASSNIIRLPFAAIVSKKVAARFYHWTLAPTAVFNIAAFRSDGSGAPAQFRIALLPSGIVQLLGASGALLGASSTAITFGVLNRFEVVYDIATPGAAKITLRVYPQESMTASVTITLTGLDLGSDIPKSLEIGSPYTASATQTQYFDSVSTNDGATAEIGPYVVVAPLAAPVVTVTKTNPSVFGASDGSITWTWTSVAGATKYESCLLSGDVVVGAVSTRSDATRTRTVTGLSAGTYTVAVRAMP